MLGTKQFHNNSNNNNKDFRFCPPKKTANENLCWMRDRKCCLRDKSISIAFCNCVQFVWEYGSVCVCAGAGACVCVLTA